MASLFVWYKIHRELSTVIVAIQVEKQQGEVAGDMGFFGSIFPRRAAKPKADSQEIAAESEQPLPADITRRQDAALQTEAQADAGDNAEERGRWGEQEEVPNGAAKSQAEDDEERGRWGEGKVSDGKPGKETAALATPVALPLDVSVDRGKWGARQSLTGTPALMTALPPHLGVRLDFDVAAPKGLPTAAGTNPEQNGLPPPEPGKQQLSEQPASAAEEKRREQQEDREKGGTERRNSAEWPALSRRDGKAGRQAEAAGRRERSRERAREDSERGRSGPQNAGPCEQARQREWDRSSDRGEHLHCPRILERWENHADLLWLQLQLIA